MNDLTTGKAALHAYCGASGFSAFLQAQARWATARHGGTDERRAVKYGRGVKTKVTV